MPVEIDLPFPPSTNRIWRYVRGRVVRSAEYDSWFWQASASYWQQFRTKPKITGHFRIAIVLDSSQRGSSDGDNRIKALLDFLQRLRVIDNDKDCDGGSWEWGAADAGCRVVLTEVAAKAIDQGAG